jgi:hypothetical protein
MTFKGTKIMVNNVYPGTTHRPTQQIDFYLSGNVRVRAVLSIQPSAIAGQIGDVHLQATEAGSDLLNTIPTPGENLSVFEAGTRAYQYVQSEAQRRRLQLDRVTLEGQEFLEVADVLAIIGRVVPVTVV